VGADVSLMSNTHSPVALAKFRFFTFL